MDEFKKRQCEKTLYDYLRIHATAKPDKTCFATDSSAMTYGETLAATDQTAARLMSFGVKKGDLVALRAERCPQTAIIAMALSAFGGIAVMTDVHFRADEYIKQTGVGIRPDYYVTSEGSGDRWTLKDGDYADLCDVTPGDLGLDVRGVLSAHKLVSPDDPFSVIFTSGSTGASKAVVLSHRNCMANPVDAMPLFGENETDRAVSILPLNHVFGFAVVSCAIFCGHDVVFPTEVGADAVLGAIEKYGVTVMYSVPTFFLDMLAGSKHKKYDISSLRLGLMAGGPFTADQMRFIEGELGLRLMPGYGMSECVGISTTSYGASVEERAAGVGRLYPMTECDIIGENGEKVRPGEEGEIRVKGPTLMLGYYGDEEATKAAFDGQGRLRTGDIGYFDPDGILHISGRLKDIIIRGGENISAGKIERALLSIDGVYQAAAVGVRDEKYGETPCAMIIPAPGAKLTENALKKSLASLLSGHEIPERIKIVDAFPLTSSGKPDKQKMKEIL